MTKRLQTCSKSDTDRSVVWTTFVVLMVCSAGLWNPPQPVIAAADPATTAVDISVLEAQGRFSDIYDQMHPDAQAFIPRAAVVGWYENDFDPLGPGVITVTNVAYVSWRWPVTGKTYANTAEVSFTQPFANGTVVSEVVRLVESDGNWRWFFGRSRAFVDEQVAKYPENGFGRTSIPGLDYSSSPQSVWFEPESLALRPGETGSMSVHGVSQLESPTLQVVVPAVFEIGNDSTCSASALVVPAGQSAARARPEALTCSGRWELVNGGQAWSISMSTSDAFQRAITYNVLLNFNITAPPNAQPGMRYTLFSPIMSLREETVSATVEILGPD